MTRRAFMDSEKSRLRFSTAAVGSKWQTTLTPLSSSSVAQGRLRPWLWLARNSSTNSDSTPALSPSSYVSSDTAMASAEDSSNAIDERTLKLLQDPFYTKPTVVHTADGREMVAFRTGYHPRLKPRLVARRLRNLKTYIGTQKDIRGSPWKLNCVCQFTTRMPLEEALLQLTFLKRKKAPLVKKVLARTSNLADIRHGIQKSALEVAECFATPAKTRKGIKPMGKGQAGRLRHRSAHMRVVLREIDFQLKIYQARTIREKKYWFQLQQRAEREAAKKNAEREEEQRLEREAAKKAQINEAKK